MFHYRRLSFVVAALAAAITVASSPATTAVATPTTYPLHTSGRWILRPDGQRVKLASVNWSGAESPEFVVGGLDRATIGHIAGWIRANGFNSVRIPWSNEMYEHNPVVADRYVRANPELKGKRALDVLDRVVDALGRAGLMVVLDNHVSRADWCCNGKDGNGLWYTAAYPESHWIADWRGIVTRYRNRPQVVAAELRNEIRDAGGVSPTWGDGNPRTDWAAAAERGGNAVLAANRNLLVVVGGLNYQTDLTGAYHRPIRLKVGGRLVYAAHAYKWEYDVNHGYGPFSKQLGARWGYLVAQGKPYTAPVWVSEFGTCITWTAGCDKADSNFSNGIQRYLREGDIDWAYWQLNGTQSAGTGRQHGALDYYGLLNTAWTGAANAASVARIKALEKMTQRP
ncbi:endoglucanase [Kutzneria buriramensis]|uniref:Endoglucanase n=2 Tax=Kutzneria buriramensis TaxID=1045776 RepID=A0A3E0GVQ0_9PSEU|nr:endoglucanase [Kutzneria buriramensis]